MSEDKIKVKFIRYKMLDDGYTFRDVISDEIFHGLLDAIDLLNEKNIEKVEMRMKLNLMYDMVDDIKSKVDILHEAKYYD